MIFCCLYLSLTHSISHVLFHSFSLAHTRTPTHTHYLFHSFSKTLKILSIACRQQQLKISSTLCFAASTFFQQLLEKFGGKFRQPKTKILTFEDEASFDKFFLPAVSFQPPTLDFFSRRLKIRLKSHQLFSSFPAFLQF